jgi:hypothetical protein
MSSEIDVVAGQYYPVRIQYSQAALTMLYNFNVYILKMETGQRVKWKFDGVFFSLTDRNNLNYEPIQMAMALRNDKGEKEPPCSTATCLLSTRVITIKQRNIRKSRGQDSKIFKSFILTPKDGVGNSKPN